VAILNVTAAPVETLVLSGVTIGYAAGVLLSDGLGLSDGLTSGLLLSEGLTSALLLSDGLTSALLLSEGLTSVLLLSLALIVGLSVGVSEDEEGCAPQADRKTVSISTRRTDNNLVKGFDTDFSPFGKSKFNINNPNCFLIISLKY
jgi:hypothetical protein